MTAIASLLSTTAVPLTATPPGAGGATLIPFPELTLAAEAAPLPFADAVLTAAGGAAPVRRQAVAGTGNALPPAPSDDAALAWLGVDMEAVAAPGETTTGAAGVAAALGARAGGSKPVEAAPPLSRTPRAGSTITPARHAAATVRLEMRQPGATLPIGQAVAQVDEGARDAVPVTDEDAAPAGTADAGVSETIAQPLVLAAAGPASVIADLGPAVAPPFAEYRASVTASPDATTAAGIVPSPHVGVVPTGSAVAPAKTGVVDRPATFSPGTHPATGEQVGVSLPQRADVPGSALRAAVPTADASAPTVPATGDTAAPLPTRAQDLTPPTGLAPMLTPLASRVPDAPADTAAAPARFRTEARVPPTTARLAARVAGNGERAVTTMAIAPTGRLLPPGTVPTSSATAPASITAPTAPAKQVVPPAASPMGEAAMPASVATRDATRLGVPSEATPPSGRDPLTVPDRAVSSDPMPARLPIAALTPAVTASVPTSATLVAGIAAPTVGDVPGLVTASFRSVDRATIGSVLPDDAGVQAADAGLVTPAVPAAYTLQSGPVAPPASAALTPVAIPGAPRLVAVDASAAPVIAGIRSIATPAFTVTSQVPTPAAVTAPVSPPAATSPNDAPVAGDGAVRATGFAMRTAEPTLRPLGSIALPPAPPAPVTTSAPAAQVFAAAIHRALGEQDARQPGDGVPASAVTAPVLAGITATGGAQHGALDLRQEHWPAAMIERIVSLRDMAAENDTRLRLSPDMLGTIDVSLKRDGDQVQVQITAEQAQTRAMLADAQQRLVELADARGVKLQVSGGLAGGAGQQPGPGNSGGGDAPRQQTPGNPLPTRPRSAERAADDTDQRIA